MRYRWKGRQVRKRDGEDCLQGLNVFIMELQQEGYLIQHMAGEAVLYYNHLKRLMQG